MQAKDIDDAAFLDAVVVASQLRWGRVTLVSRWDVGCVLAGVPERIGTAEATEENAIPQKVVMAKARKLIRRGLLFGCTCGCRGDYDLTA